MTDTPEPSLDEIGLRFDCDKSSRYHDYLRVYGSILPGDRNASFTLLELGWSDLSSMRVWTHYFPNARIVGSFPSEPARKEGDDRFIVDVGSPTDPRYLTGLIERYEPDIVIDDASHVWSHQKAALGSIVPLLKAGAVYIVEDLQTSFGDTKGYDEGKLPKLSTARYLMDIVPALASGKRVFADPIDEFQRFAPEVVEQIAFRNQLCVITRNARETCRLAVRTEVEAERVTELDNGGPYARVPARIEGLEPARRAQFASISAATSVSAPAARVTVLRDAVVYGRGLVTTARRELLRDSLINIYDNQASFEGLYRIVGTSAAAYHGGPPASPDWDDRPCVLLKQRWDGNFGHWLVESLARLALVRQTCDLAACNYIVGRSSPTMEKVCLDSLASAGIEAGQVKFTDDTPLAIRHLVYPHPLTVQPWVKAPLVLRYLEEIRDAVLAAGVEPHDQPERIFVHRAHSSRRKLLNQDELAAIATSMGFQVVAPAKLSFRQQVFAFSRARSVVGGLGAELTNIVFSPGGVGLLGLSPQTMQDDFYYDVVCLKQGRYLSVHGPESGPSSGLEADFTIDPGAFRSMLDALVGGQS